jgi:hypothetical protein
VLGRPGSRQAVGLTSAPVKVEDPEIRKLVEVY